MITLGNLVCLGNLIVDANCGFASGKRDSSGISQVRMNNVGIDGVLDLSDVIRVPASKKQIESNSLLPGDVLFNCTNSVELVGKSALFKAYDKPIAYSNHFIRLRVDKKKVDPLYLSRWLIYQYRRGVFRLLCNRWVNQATVPREALLKLQVPLPKLTEQKRIAAILGKADTIRRKRQQAIQLADEFLRSAFLDMFGDPVANPKGWELGTLGDFILSATDGPHVSPKYSTSGIPFLSTRHVRPGRIIWKDLKFINREEAEKQWRKCKPEKGDILYTKGGTTGIAAVFDSGQEIAVWVHVALLKTNHEKADSVWLERMLNTGYCYAQSQRFTHGITNKDLGLTRMVNIEMYSPPLEMQKKFSEIVAKTKNIMTKHTRQVVKSDNLFNSLTQHAFRGEL